MAALIKEKRTKRLKLVTDARALLNKAKAEKRELTTEENQSWDTMMAEVDTLKTEIDTLLASENREARMATLESEMNEREERRTEQRDPSTGPGADPKEERGEGQPSGRRRNSVAEDRGGNRVITYRGAQLVIAAGTAAGQHHTKEYFDAFRSELRGETRNLQTSLDVQGGYMATPEEVVAGLLQNLDDEVVIRRMGTVYPIVAQTLGVVKRTSKMQTWAWGSELSSATDDTSLKFGKRSLEPHYMTGSTAISRNLIRSAIMDPIAIVQREMARDSGELEENAYLYGNGNGQPLGLFTASSDGISTARDSSTSNTSTAITWLGLMSARGRLKHRYRANATWLIHRDVETAIMKLTDSQGRFLWQPSVKDGEPDTILRIPYQISEFAPNTFTTGQYIAMLGDFSFYWIADQLMMDLQVLDQTKARQNQIEYIGRRKTDGMPILEEAFVRVALA